MFDKNTFMCYIYIAHEGVFYLEKFKEGCFCMKKIIEFFKNVKNEMKKVHWPDKKYIGKYTVVTLGFVLILSGYFTLISMLMAFLKAWLR